MNDSGMPNAPDTPDPVSSVIKPTVIVLGVMPGALAFRPLAAPADEVCANAPVASAKSKTPAPVVRKRKSEPTA